MASKKLSDLRDENDLIKISSLGKRSSKKRSRIHKDTTDKRQVIQKENPIDADDPSSSLDSDDEEELNKIGRVPLRWYESLKHIGYTRAGEKILKTVEFPDLKNILNSTDDPEAWRNLVDVKNQCVYRLTDEDIDIIKRVQAKKFPDSNYDPYGPDSYVEFDNPEEAIHPTLYKPEPKRRFLPSKHEFKKVLRLLKLIKKGRIRFSQPSAPELYDLWGSNIFLAAEEGKLKGLPSIPAPKMPLPGHSESYNTPDEYMWDDEEKQAWLESDEKSQAFLPQQYDCLRHVPGYNLNLVERFQRCLDLYLCPRTIKMKMNVDPASLLPPLPTIDDLRPFPERLSVTYESNSDESVATSLSFDSTGTYLAVGRKKGVLEVFDVQSSRLVCVYGDSSSPVTCVQFNPAYPIIAFTKGTFVYFVGLPLPAFSRVSESSQHNTSDALDLMQPNVTEVSADDFWEKVENTDKKGYMGWKVDLGVTATSVSWHKKGLYAATVCRYASSPSAQFALHSIKKLKTLRPIRTNLNGKIVAAQFHPTKNWLFLAPQKDVRIYNLEQNNSGSKGGQQLMRFTGVDQVQCLAVHPSGEIFVVGSGNNRLTWYDFDLGQKPYKTLRNHNDSVNAVGFHNKYPLMFSASSDGTIQVFHVAIDPDLLTPPTLIPVNKITPAKLFEQKNLKEIQSCVWHPKQPWVAVGLSSGHVGLMV